MASKQFNSVDGYSIGNATVVVDSGANITAAKLTANGNVSFTGANVSLGSNSNVKITGGSSGQYLQTDGTGNLSWQAVTVSTASISNGNSNVNIPAANGNIQVSVAGTANVITFTSNNAFRGSYGLTGIVSQSNTAPSNPQNGDQWYNTFNGILFEYLDDGTSSQWVDISSLPTPNIATVNASAVLNNVQSTGTFFPAFISSTANGNYQLNSNTAFSANLANGAMIATTFVGALSGAATSATTAGTVTTAAQPNITSVGTLTSLAVTGNANVGNLNATTAVIASTLTSNVATGTAPLTVTSTTRVANLNVAQANVADFISAAAGTGNNFLVFANAATGNVAELTSTGLTANLSNNSITATTFVGALSGAATSATTAGTVTTAAQPNITSVGTLTSLGVSGTVTAVAFTANTGVFTGNGSGLSAIAGANVTGTVSSATSATTAGTVTTAAQPNITSVGTLTSATVTGNVAAGNLTTTGVLSVTGTGVSSIAGNLDMTSNTIINLATPTNPTDAATKQYVDDVAQGLNVHDSVAAATPTTLATITGGTITYNNGSSGVGANLVTTGTFNLIDGVNVQTAGTRILVRSEANAVHNGIYTWSNATVITRATDYDSVPEVEAGDFVFVTGGTLYDNTGWVQTSTVSAIGTAGNNIDFTQFSGAGTYTAGTGLTLTGSVFSVNASQTQITSVGTLGSLAVTGNATAGNVYANSGTVGASLLTGTLTTAAQPNITSVGTLTGLGVNGTITAVNITANTGVFTGNGSALTALNASNISSGTLAQARLANASVTLGSTALTLGSTVTTVAGLSSVTSTTFVGSLSGAATTAGTVTTAAQPNITSVGTLTGLTVSTGTGQVLTSTDAGGSMSFGLTSGTASTPYIDFNTSATPVDFNVRIQASGNTASIGSGTLSLQAATTTISGSLQTTALTTGANSTAGTVTGNWTLTAGSRWQATYADLAEKYAADDTYEPGTVLLFGGEQEVTLSNAFDSTKVAGVVTTNPAYSMNAMLEAEYVAEIALQGRVPCKVQGPVEKGDLMVSASNGHATANNDARAGTIIGKALENFNGDFGIIEVAVGRF